MNILLVGGTCSLMNNIILKLRKEGHRVFLLTGDKYKHSKYEKVFESDEVLHAEKEAYGSIFHNMGVAYSNLAEFRKAAEYFLKAYEQNKKDASLSQGLFALRLSKDVEGYKKALVDFDVSPEKQLQWEKEYTQVISQSSQCREALKIEKLRNVMKSGNVAEYYDKVHKYVLDWKNEYRKQIV